MWCPITPTTAIPPPTPALASRRRQLNETEEEVRQFEAEGGHVPGVGPLREEIARTEELAAGFLDHWPRFGPLDVEQARADYARGKSVDLDEAFAGLLGVTPEQLREKAAARKSG